MTKRRNVVVVDGSNLATEGRTMPSLRQLDESVKAFLAENPDHDVIVVVDATFEHRVAPAEREQVKQAELSGEIVTPPAGAIGRGDAFILKIAKRADAVVLSNDSFQEFHAEHPWLFEDGRLIGGKPVSRVGWIFTPRIPVRGLKSKAVTKKAARVAAAEASQHDDAAPTPAARPATSRRARSGAETTRPATAKVAAKKAIGRAVTKKSTETAETTASTPKARTEPRLRAAEPKKRTQTTKRARKAGATKSGAVTEPSASRPKRTGEAPAKGRVEPVNTQRSFQRLVTDHAVGGPVDGEVVQFTSHGAMVSVSVGRTMHVVCYAPLAGLGSPTPVRARDALKKGETYRFTIVAFDSTRRRAELALARS